MNVGYRSRKRFRLPSETSLPSTAAAVYVNSLQRTGYSYKLRLRLNARSINWVLVLRIRLYHQQQHYLITCCASSVRRQTIRDIFSARCSALLAIVHTGHTHYVMR
eukprot:6174341-Pleurochrysis_carterae.AAC.1